MHNFFHSIPAHNPMFAVAFAVTVLVGFGILALLQIMPARYRKPLISLATFIGGLYYVLEFFWPVKKGADGNFLTPYQNTVADITMVLGCFAVGLGIISLIGYHLKVAANGRKQAGFSWVLLISFVLMATFTFLNEYAKNKPALGFIHSFTNRQAFVLLFNGGLTSLDSAMFALIGFLIISASYRAFRVKTVDASILMASAVLVMLGQVSLGSSMTSFLPAHGVASYFRLENISEYILVHLNSPAQRAVTFGLALGLLATSLRLWLSLERGLYFDQEA